VSIFFRLLSVHFRFNTNVTRRNGDMGDAQEKAT
jgi:hypothetical protein